MDTVMAGTWKQTLFRERYILPARYNPLRHVEARFHDWFQEVTTRALTHVCVALWMVICFVPLLKLRRLLKGGHDLLALDGQ